MKTSYRTPIATTLAIAASLLCTSAAADSDPNLDRAVAEVRADLGPKMHVSTLEGVLVVASNQVKKYREITLRDIAKVYAAITNEYVDTAPAEPIKIYLFTSDTAYQDYCVQTYGETQDTPFGFYVPSERKMVMNVATGGGTLRHELAHPMLEADFPDVPAWFNEGFASIFEGAYHTRGSKMRGMVNWRFPGLADYVRRKDTVHLRRLMTTTTEQFYDEWGGLGYAVARHFLIYLERRGLLASYYKAFRDNAAEDPTGIDSLEATSGESLEELEADFLRWVKRERYRRR